LSRTAQEKGLFQCSKEFKDELKGRNVLGEVVHTEHSVH